MLSSEDSKNLLLVFAGVQAIDIQPGVAEWNTIHSSVSGFANQKHETRPFLRFVSDGVTSQVFPRTTTSREEFPRAIPHKAHSHGCCVSRDGDVLTFDRRTLPNHNFGAHSNPCKETDSNWLAQFSLALKTSASERKKS
jgi:hypothetical protein